MAASPAVTGADAPPRVVEDCRVLSDGTVVRSAPPAADDVPADPSVEWKDVVYDAALSLSLRVYRPSAVVAGAGERLPVVVVFHGGGFCIGAYALPTFHAACTRLAEGTRAVVLSADYRLAPDDDILRDRNVEYVRRMAEMGKPVELVEFPGQGHAFFSLRPWAEPVDELLRVFKRFMDKVLAQSSAARWARGH